MATLVVLAVTNGGEALRAEAAQVGLFTSVSAHVHKQVAFLREDLAASGFGTLEQVVSGVG